MVKKWPAFTCKLTTLGSRGKVSVACCVVARLVNRGNGGRTTHFGEQCSCSPIAALARTFQCCPLFYYFFFVFFIDAKPPPKAVNCSLRQRSSTMLVLHDFDAFEEELLTVKAECGEVHKVCNCNLNSTPARRVRYTP